MAHHITPADVLPASNDSMPADAPTVAVVVSLNIPEMTDEVAGLVARFTGVALKELNDVGARVVLMDASRDDLSDAALADQCDGVLFLGGGDVDATIYGHMEPVNHEYGVSRAADDLFVVGRHRKPDRFFLGAPESDERMTLSQLEDLVAGRAPRPVAPQVLRGPRVLPSTGGAR